MLEAKDAKEMETGRREGIIGLFTLCRMPITELFNGGRSEGLSSNLRKHFFFLPSRLTLLALDSARIKKNRR